MAAAVTYADLRFCEIAVTELNPDDDLVENNAEDEDATYENVTQPKPVRVRTEPAAPPPGAMKRLRTGFWTPLLLLLLLSIMLLASTIGLAVKYLDLSRQLHHLSVDHMELNSSLSQKLQRKEKDLETTEKNLATTEKNLATTEKDLERSQREIKDLVWDLRDLNSTLLEYQQMAKTATHEMEVAEERLKEAESKIGEWEKGLCSEGWILFGRKCLLKSEERKNWYESRRYCEARNSNLIVVEQNDAEIQKLSVINPADIWVGKIITRNQDSERNSWDWPSSYKVSKEDRYKCWRIEGGRLNAESCWKENHFICEKNLVLMSVKENYYSSFSMWDTSYKCKVQD